jgi:endonuclease/exonuclease/phosphatase (EEP) superfamily protein YafD
MPSVRFMRNVRGWGIAAPAIALALASWGVIDAPPAHAVAHLLPLAIAYSLAAALVLWFVAGQMWPAASALMATAALCYLWLPRGAEGSAQLTPARVDAVAPRLKVLQLNVWGGNRDLARVDDLIDAGGFDLVALQECGDACYEGRARRWSKEGFFSVRLAQARMALFSRAPLSAADASFDPPMLAADVEFAPGRKVRVVSVHLDRPWPFGAQSAHEAQFRAVMGLARAPARPLIVLGDFNTVPWASWARTGLTSAGLEETRLPALPAGTWPARLHQVGVAFPLPFVPLDGIFVKNGPVPLAWNVGPDVGSDHRPLMVTLALP